MKKLFIVLVSVGFLAACNSGTGSNNAKDSALNAIDSTTKAQVDTVKAQGDSLKKEVKETFNKTDSANKAATGNADSTQKH